MRGGVALNEAEKKRCEIMCLAVSVSGMPCTLELGFPSDAVQDQGDKLDSTQGKLFFIYELNVMCLVNIIYLQ